MRPVKGQHVEGEESGFLNTVKTQIKNLDYEEISEFKNILTLRSNKKETETLHSSTTRARFANFNFDGDADLIIVDGYGYPCVLVGTGAGNLSKLSSTNKSS